jgi:lysophospholipase L1-like esterase
MSEGGPSLRDPTVGSMLLFSVAALVALLVFIGDRGSLNARIQRKPSTEVDQAPKRAAGPSFIRRQQTAVRRTEPEPPRQPKVIADGSGRAHVDFDGVRVSDPCVDGTVKSCKRYALDPFFDTLTRLERDKKGMVRISHIGDSMVASSYISRPLRSLYQERYGDGGAGFVYLGKPSRFFIRAVVRHWITKNWAVRSISAKPVKDGLYGLGGVSFSAGMGERVVIRTTKRARPGNRVSRYELYYLAHRWGGQLGISVDGGEETTLDTKADETRTAYHTIDVPDGRHKLTLTVRSGTVRGYGVVMERDSGAVLDNLGVIGASALAYSKLDEAHWAEQLRHRNPELVIVLLGSNEAVWVPNYRKAHRKYQGRYAEVLTRIRKALPGSACLVMAPLDQGIKRDDHIISNPTMPGLVAAQRRAARKQGCAFWDTFEFMGGAGSYKRWYRNKWLWTDMTHPTHIGGKKIANALDAALQARFAEYKLRRAQ